MAKIFDITGKLKLKEKPVLKYGDRNITVESSADRVLQFIDLSRTFTEDPSAIQKAAKLLFSEADWEYLIKELELDMEDMLTVLKAAVALAQGNDPDLTEDESGF